MCREWIAVILVETEIANLNPPTEPSSALLASLLRNIPGVLYRCRNDLDMTVEYVSEGVRELTGYSVDDFISGRIRQADIVLAEDGQRALAETRAALSANRPFALAYRIRTAQGKIKWVREFGRGIFGPEGTAHALEGFIEDITERKRSEDALARQAEQLKIGQATARMIVMDWDAVSDTIEWSDSPEWLRGPLPPGGKYPSYKQQVHPDDRERWLAARRDWVDRLDGENIDYRVVRTDGAVLWVHSRRTAIAGPEGKAARILVALHDITERKEAEFALLESEGRFRDFARASADWYFETDAQGRFTWISETIEQASGDKIANIVGKNRIGLISRGGDLEQEPWASHLAALARHEPFRDLRYSRRWPRGVRWISSSGVPRFDKDGAFIGYRAIGSDVTERVEAEQRARQAEQRLFAAIQNLGELITLTDAEDRIVFSNRIFLEFNARVAEYLLPGRHYVEHLRAGVALGLFPESAGREEAWLDERIAQRHSPTGPVERRRQDGRWLLVEDQTLPDGGVITFGVEITERKRAEEALRNINIDLERRVAERTVELETSNRELESFSYSVSHDLRGPLRAVTGFARILLQEEAAKLSGDGRRYLANIDASGRRMGELIDALLALGRYSRVALNKTQVDMAGLAREAGAELAASWPAAQVVVGPLPSVPGNALLLKQVFLNLVGNGLKYSANVAEPRVEIRAEGNRYIVSDNGVGFDMAYVDKLFQPFERLHTPEEFEGTGIGLAIVKRIVERHGGRVEARGAPGEGATFSFTVGDDAVA